MPSPEQIQAAMPAMREWLRANTTVAALDSYSYTGVEWLIDVHYRPGGVAQFIKD